MNTKKTGIILSIISSILTGVLGLVFSGIYLRVYGSTDFGAYNSITAYVGYLAILNCGIGSVLTRYLSIFRAKHEEDRISRFIGLEAIVLSIVSLVILVAAVIMFIMIPTIYSNTKMHGYIEKFQVIFIFSIGTLLLSLFSDAGKGIILGYEKYFIGSIFGIVLPIIKYSLIGIFLALNYDFEFITISSFIAQGVIFALTWIYVIAKLKIKISFKNMETSLLKGTLLFSFAVLLQAIVNESSTNIDKFILGQMLSPDDVTRYSLSASVFSLFSSISTVALGIYLPLFSKNVAKNYNGEQHLNEMIVPNRVQTFVSGIILFGFVSCGLDFFFLWAGPGFDVCYTISLILMVPSFLFYCTSAVVTLMDAKNLKIFRSLVLAVIALINIGTTILLINFIGILGAPIGTLISIFVGHLVIMNIYYHKKLGINVFKMYKNALGRMIFPLLIPTCFALLTYLFLPKSITGLFVRGFIFVIIFIVLFLLFGLKKDERKTFFIKIKNFGKKKV